MVQPRVPAITASHNSICPWKTRNPAKGMITSEGRGAPILSTVIVKKTAQEPKFKTRIFRYSVNCSNISVEYERTRRIGNLQYR